jgi:DNA polymerase-3 subunit beta
MTQIVIPGKEFKSMVAALKLIAPKKTIFELLGYARFLNQCFTVTDLTNWINYQAYTDNDFEFTKQWLISIKDLQSIDKAVKTVKKQYHDVVIDFQAKTATVGATAFKIDCKLDTDNDFPEIPEPSPPGTKLINELPTELINDIVNSVGYAMSNDETRQTLTGLHLTCGNTMIEAAATDGHRMAVYNIHCDDIENAEVTLNPKLVKTFAAIKTWEYTVQLAIGVDMTMISDSKITLVGRNLVGQYPRYQSFFPDLSQGNIARYVTSDIKDITKAVFSDSKAAFVKLWLHDNRISDKTEHIETIVQAEIQGNVPKDKTLVFVAKYINDLLSVVKESIVEFKFIDNIEAPVIVKTQNCKHLIMPINERT